MNLGEKAVFVTAVLTDVICGGQPVETARARLIGAGFAAETAHKIMAVEFSAMFLAVIRAQNGRGK